MASLGWFSLTVSSHNMADRRTMLTGARMSPKLWIACFSVVVVCHGAFGAKSHRKNTHFPQERFSDEAIDRLRELFGFEQVPQGQHHRSPPQYMQDLFNTVAYSDGITRSPNPFDADVVRGFPDKGNVGASEFNYHRLHFDFILICITHPLKVIY